MEVPPCLIQNFNFGIWNQIVSRCNKEAPKVKKAIFYFLLPFFTPLKLTASFITRFFPILIMWFMVLKTTGLSSWFQRKDQFWKMYTDSWDIDQNVSKFSFPNKTTRILDILANILGPDTCFSKLILTLKLQGNADCFEYHEPNNQKKKISCCKWGYQFWRVATNKNKHKISA